jgi:hypothetical protein
MAAFTDAFENRLIDWLLRGQTLGLATGSGTGPTTTHIGLFTTTPTDSTAGTEVSGNGYARVAVTSSLANWAGTQAAASTVASSGNTGTTSNNAAITFPAPSGGNWGVITGFGIFDAATGGNLLIYGALTTQKTVNQNDAAPSFAAAALTFQIDN